MKPLNLAIIGCGVIGKQHINAAQRPDIRVVAVADVRLEAAQEVAAKFNVPKAFDNADAVLADKEVEAVVLALPANVRAPLAIKTLKAGKHALIEKPIGMNAGEVRQIIAARGDRVAACCSSRMHYIESARQAKAFLAKKPLGELRMVRCRAIQAAGPTPTKTPPPWRLKKALNGGGILANWGCYDLDYLMGLLDWELKPQRVFGQTWTICPAFTAYAAPDSDAETHYTALIRCAGGIILSIERAEFAPMEQNMAWDISGSKGSLKLFMTPGKDKQVVHYYGDAQKGAVSEVIWQGTEEWSYNPGLMADFVASIREHRPPQTTLEKGLIVQQITDAVYQSAQSGQAVEIRA